MNARILNRWLMRAIGAMVLLAAGLFATSASAVNLTPLPPYLTETKGSPMVMLNLSRDHQLSYKAYNEFSDLDGDGVIETQYSHTYKYYGYFDNQRCYTYDTGANYYVPTRKVDATNYCNYGGALANEWSGNFLNWATMTRMDVIRRILYGGMRSNGAASTTILERAHLPTDAHAFAKYYNANDIAKLTPYSGTSEITICNATFRNGTLQYSHDLPGPPAMLVAKGNYSLWNSNERWQCYWSEDKPANNGNNPAVTGLNAAGSNPSRGAGGQALGPGGSGLNPGTYTVRVQVCKTGLDLTDPTKPDSWTFTDDEKNRCKLYPNGNYKPVGLLQKYGERNEAGFGLMTGSYQKNISGGVLRKNIAPFAPEVDLPSGNFTGVDGIVSTLDKLRIYGYDYDQGYYLSADQCDYGMIGLVEGRCGSWGNPIGEMYLESLRYMAGAAPTGAFNTSGGKDAALGLTVATWTDPFADSTVATFGAVSCRRSSVVNFNASVSSYDNDQWSSATGVKGLTEGMVSTLTNDIGAAEGLYATGKKWTVGRTTGDTNNLCSDKTITALADSVGICPEAPTGYGGFLMAGAAQYAHTNRIRDTTPPLGTIFTDAFKVDTYGVALATSTPRIQIPVPNQAGKFVVIQPAMRLFSGTGGAGALVDFRVVSQTPTNGKFVVQWEDSEQGGDYDQDMWGTLEYSVANGKITVTTYAAYNSTPYAMGFGYAIGGTDRDGVHMHSGINGAVYADPNPPVTVTPATNLSGGGCNGCYFQQPATAATFTMTGVSGEALRDPMWYAAKYGGFDRGVAGNYASGSVLPVNAWDSKKVDGSPGSDGIPDKYFYAIDPAQLERSLASVFNSVFAAGGAAPAAATTSRTQTGGYVYASTYSVKPKTVGSPIDADNSGEFARYSFDANGVVNLTEDWKAGALLTNALSGLGWNGNRTVLTMRDTGPVAFRWGNLSTTQQTALNTNPANGVVDANGSSRLDWLRGDASNESDTGYRIRTARLGAIINSTPWYVGAPAAGYTNAQYGGGYGAFRTGIVAANGNKQRAAVFVGANDGMLHAFDGADGHELFAYLPRAFYTTTSAPPYSKLTALTAKDFYLGESTDRLTMDGSVMAADVKVGTTWSTYLFGAFGRGAKGVYALDVTKPHTITETSGANLVKWEFTEASEAAPSDMGYITGRTNIRSNGQPFQSGYMANGKWAAIYGNGYNSATGRAALYILFADGPATAGATGWAAGTEFIKIVTPKVATTETDNGLASPTAIDTNNDGIIDRIYAGDLYGNVWKFDVSSANPANWKIANVDGSNNPVPLYKATTLVGTVTTPQPITTPITTFPNPQGGYQLVFATGKALESNDYPMTVAYTNTMYGIYDKPGIPGTLTVGKTALVQQTLTDVSGIRYIAAATVNYTGGQFGWYANLPVTSEGVVFNPFGEDTNRVNIRSLAPAATSNGCRFDGNSFDMALDPINGVAIPGAVPGVTTAGAVGITNLNYFEGASGGQFRIPATPPPNPDGSPGTPGACAGQCLFRSIISAGDGTLKTVNRCGACTDGRITWREIFRNR
ncbi:PilC/PilY family type IV pilus protein [Variovorax sp. dw_954]|uniref:pilus assembly protein n=1 Tax=Variovorax sp. dw_954 TaxID=2720078 RepID=UPI001BD2044E|nr:PilC/PilY family type IV pilus protein [Variovorax sp. dw_954]